MNGRWSLLLGSALAGSTLLVALAAPLLATFDPFLITGSALEAPSTLHWFGTDALGRDVWSRVVWGSRTSWLIGISVAGASTLVGTGVGVAAAQTGGWTEAVLMRSVDLILVLPRFFLAILVVALFGPGVDRIVAVLAATSWAGLARIVRAETLSLQEREFVLAAEASGSSRWQIAAGELLPNLLPTILVLAALMAGRVILIEAGLAFLGLGDPSVTSWGAMAGEANATLRLAWWPAAAPGFAIVCTVLGLNLLSNAATDSEPLR